MEKMILSKFTEIMGRERFFLSIEDAVEACRFSLQKDKKLDQSAIALRVSAGDE